LDLHPFAPEVIEDPYRWYELLRRTGPVARLRNPDLYVVTGYAEIVTALRNPEVFSSTVGYRAMATGHLRPGQDTSNMFGVDVNSMRMLISTDPPEHTRIRRLQSRAFTPRAIADLEPRLHEVCDELIADLLANGASGNADLVRDLASPFPLTVIAELLDVPAERRADFRRWSDALAGGLSGDVDVTELANVGLELFSFMSDVVQRRQADPGNDLISRLLVTTADDEDDDPLSFEEITLIAIMLLAAGNETTTNLLGNAFNAFATHPGEAERVWSDPSLVPNAIEEVLRRDSPVQCLLRGTTEPISLGGTDLPVDSIVLLSFAAANRDPAKFPDPDRFDVTRGAADHLAFGHGIHFCLGASLARNEARIALETLIATGTEIGVAPDAVRTTNLFLRGYTSFPFVSRACERIRARRH
jgi:cytochrome P450